MLPRFDAYTATSRAIGYQDVLNIAARAVAISDVRNGSGYHGFDNRLSVKDSGGHEALAIQWGGRMHRDLVMFEAKGETTPAIVDAFREAVPSHRCTRVDSCADFEQPDAWESMCSIGLGIKREFGLRGEKRGDWDYPEDGRTLYLGAATSAVRVRIYEKGKQPEYRHLARFDLVRAEVQVRPEDAARVPYAAATASEVWGASPFTRAIAARVLEAQVKPLSPYSVRRQSARDRALAVMCEQYASHLVGLKSELGNWACVGAQLGYIITEHRKKR